MLILENKGVFVLETKNTHYVISVDPDGLICHEHWGRKCADIEDYRCTCKPWERNSNHSARDLARTEYIPYGGTCYRTPAFAATYDDNCREAHLTYKDFNVTFEDEDTFLLEIILEDKPYGIEVSLFYRLRENTDIIERFVKITNRSDKAVTLNKIASAEFTLPSTRPYSSTNFNGSWGAEFRKESTTVKNGVLTYENRKGGSNHTHSPLFILSQNATEKEGDVFFGALAWSGNYKVEISRDFAGITRAVIGINDFDFSYTLKPGKEFIAPSVFCGYVKGFSQMSNQMNSYAVEHILPKSFNKVPLPVLYNSWEATWFDVSSETQQKLAEIAADIGCELFVMDDGWFGQRKNDRAGLGDWYVNKEKFPEGLTPLIDKVKELGMRFGLWFEPEMVNPDSDLYRAHPDWAYHYDTREADLLRQQLVLNLTKDEVKEYVFDVMDKMLSKYDISYIKWDMNRAYSQTGAENLENPQELWYRHVKAVYEIADRLKAKYPCLQLECCASGGGRADLGALSHFDMVWTSDNTDPVDRLTIQQGFSLLYPIKCMRAWVTDTNRHSRPKDFDYRFNVTMQGSLSIGGNLTKYTEQELEIHRKYIALYKEIRETVQFGSFYRLANFDDDKIFATQYVKDGRSVLFLCRDVNTFFNDKFYRIKLDGLDGYSRYNVEIDGKTEAFSGDYLMNVGLEFEMGGTLQSKIILIDKVNA
ncbi:MAG: alpha-galactosidase [Ruminococcaceae bacterium]|nr:alpha-galactosidase [Oscillospiraceae bacterium]